MSNGVPRPATPSLEEIRDAIRATSIADLAWGPMDREEAARFLSVTEDHFDRLAPSIPRKKKRGLGYRYLRSDVLGWLDSGDDAPPLEEDGEDPPRRQRRQPDGNAGSGGVSRGKKNGGKGKVSRLV